MDIETILSSLEEEVRRWRGLAALETEDVLRDADLQKAAALSAAAEIVGRLGHTDRLDTLDSLDSKMAPEMAPEMEPVAKPERIKTTPARSERIPKRTPPGADDLEGEHG